MGIILFIFCLCIAVLSGRITLILAREHHDFRYNALWRTALGALVLPSQIALVVWAFSTMQWYWAIVMILTIATLAGLPVTKNNLAAFYKLQPAIDITAIATTIILWEFFYPY